MFIFVDLVGRVFEAVEKVLKMLSSTVRLLPKIILKLFNRIEGNNMKDGDDNCNDW